MTMPEASGFLNDSVKQEVLCPGIEPGVDYLIPGSMRAGIVFNREDCGYTGPTDIDRGPNNPDPRAATHKQAGSNRDLIHAGGPLWDCGRGLGCG